MRVCHNTAPNCDCRDLEFAVTMGTFDGVHRGHMSIIESVVTSARERGLKSALITFDRHPISVLYPDKAPSILTTLDEKLAIIERTGVDIAYVVRFTKEIAGMTADEFVERFMVSCLGMKHFIVGYDHAFGKGRDVSNETLLSLGDKYGFSLTIADPVSFDGAVVSSSLIREHLLNGDVADASQMLGREYNLQGNVVPGNGIGRKLGFPTANIDVEHEAKLVPGQGVYSGCLTIDGVRRRSVVSIGPRPTFNDSREIIEAHVLDFSGDLYGKRVTLSFDERIRDLRKFNSENDLKNQIQKDIEQVSTAITN